MTGWVGLALLLVGSWQIAARRRQAFYWSFAGNLLWFLRGCELKAWDLLAETAAFMALAVWGWWKWRK